jgi:ABC-type sugar transport system ATPase subunit
MPGLSINGLCKRFGDLVVLDNISIESPSGELLVLLGSSGCGKSTLLRCVAGLEGVDDGRIELNSRRLDTLPPARRDVAMVFQNYSLYPHMSVARNLAFPLKVARLARDEIKKRVEETAALLGLGDQLDKKPVQLSGGQRQRVALGRAIIRRPSLFLLDEPLSNLDADLRVRMRREIVRLQRELGITTIHVTHDQAEALTMADRIALLHQGRLEQVGTPEELYRTPDTLYVARFIGQPAMNTVPLDKDCPLALWLREVLLRSDVKTGRSDLHIIAGIRPEQVWVDPEGPIEAQVISEEYLGEQYVVTFDVGGRNLVASHIKQAPEPGSRVHLNIDARAILWFDGDSGVRVGV